MTYEDGPGTGHPLPPAPTSVPIFETSMDTGITRTPSQLFALVLGDVYVIVGVVGFFVASEFTKGTADDQLVIFRLNHLHNLIHVVLGIGWLGASRSPDLSKSINTVFGVVLILVAILGFMALGLMHTVLNVTESTDPDNFLHVLTGGLSLYFGTAGAGEVRAATT